VSIFRNTSFHGNQEFRIIQNEEVLPSEGHDTQNLAEELSERLVTQQVFQELRTEDTVSQRPDQGLLQRGQAPKEDLLSESNDNKDQGIFPESSDAKLPDENVLSEDCISEQTVPSKSLANQQQGQARVSGSGDDRSNVKDMSSGIRNIQHTFPSGHATRRVGPADQQRVFSESHAPREGVFSGDTILGQEVLSGSRLTPRFDIRTAPRQLDMGK